MRVPSLGITCTTLAALAEPTTGMVRSSCLESVDEYGLLFLRQQNQINVLWMGVQYAASL